MNIRMIALDLDGTTMNSRHELSAYNQETLEEAIRRGIAVVVASGRVHTALPAEVLGIKGLRYAISSNGAHIVDLETGELLYSNCLHPEAVRGAIKLSREHGLPMEVFTGGKAYIDAGMFEAIVEYGRLKRNREYIRRTRKPLQDVCAFMEEHTEDLENINFFFETPEQLEEARPLIEALPHATITSSVENNLEVGGETTSKADAVRWLLEHLNISREQLMAFGDARNDIPMIQLARIGVAMGNAWDEVKAAADYITDTNDGDGVGKAIRKLVLQEQD